MRLGVLDIGSNTGHLLVVDAHGGAAPLPASSHKQPLRLAEHLDADGAVTPKGIAALTDFCASATEIAEDKGCEEMLGFATSAVCIAEAQKSVRALTPFLVTAPSSSRCSARRSGCLCEEAGSGAAPPCASTTSRWPVLDPMSRTPRRIPATLLGSARA